YLMGKGDRLNYSDVAKCFFASMLLMSIIFYTTFRYFNPEYKKDATAGNKSIAEQLDNAFTNEIEKAYSCLNNCDSLIAKDSMLQTDIRSLNNKNAIAGNIYSNDSVYGLIDSSTLSTIQKFEDGLNINQFFWMNGLGRENYIWTLSSFFPPHGDYSKRD